jgi:hypothetical protein
MHFDTKSYLKSTRNHTVKYAFRGVKYSLPGNELLPLLINS